MLQLIALSQRWWPHCPSNLMGFSPWRLPTQHFDMVAEPCHVPTCGEIKRITGTRCPHGCCILLGHRWITLQCIICHNVFRMVPVLANLRHQNHLGSYLRKLFTALSKNTWEVIGWTVLSIDVVKQCKVTVTTTIAASKRETQCEIGVVSWGSVLEILVKLLIFFWWGGGDCWL